MSDPQPTVSSGVLPCAASHPSDPFVSHGAHKGALPLSIAATLVLVLTLIVYCLGTSQSTADPGVAKGVTQTKPPERHWPITEPLPPAAEDMRQAILGASQSGSIDELKVAFDLGELRADIADEAVSDPVAYWKKLSSDGEGREILAILGNMLAVGPAEVAHGKDPENTAVYVWPYLAEVPLDKLTPAQQVDLLRLMPASEAKALVAEKKWTWWRLSIGADGLWHAFKKGK